MKEIISVLICFVFLVSCETQEICETNLKAEAIASFYTYRDGNLADTIISGTSMHGIRENLPDSLLYDSAKVSKIHLPLDPGNNHSSFVLKIQNIADTIDIYHSSYIYLVSYACGFSNNFEVGSVNYTKHNIKSIELLNENVNAEETDVKEHIRIYF